MELTASASFAGAEETQSFLYNRSVRQGGVESPWEWNVVMRHSLAVLAPSCEQRGFGIDIPYVRKLSHAVWADNCYFISTQLEHVSMMMQEFTDMLVAAGMWWKEGSLQVVYTGSASNPCCFELAQMGCSIPVESVERMEALGSIISNDEK